MAAEPWHTGEFTCLRQPQLSAHLLCSPLPPPLPSMPVCALCSLALPLPAAIISVLQAYHPLCWLALSSIVPVLQRKREGRRIVPCVGVSPGAHVAPRISLLPGWCHWERSAPPHMAVSRAEERAEESGGCRETLRYRVWSAFFFFFFQRRHWGGWWWLAEGMGCFVVQCLNNHFKTACSRAAQLIVQRLWSRFNPTFPWFYVTSAEPLRAVKKKRKKSLQCLSTFLSAGR